MLLAAAVLTAVAWNRGAEYDEQYTLFLTAGTARPIWPDTAFPAGFVIQTQSGHASFAAIASDLRRTDVHPPLYFWAAAAWRWVFGSGLFAVRLLSVLCGLGSLTAVGIIARRSGIVPWLAMLLTLGCYGFAYTAGIARGFALAEMLLLWGVVCFLSGRRGWAGALFGAAVLSNYLAVFVALAVLCGRVTTGVCRGVRWGMNASFLDAIAQTRHADAGRHPRLVPQSVEKSWLPTCVGMTEKGQRLPRIMEHRCLQVFPALGSWIGFCAFLALALWFFVAQKGSRTGQFPPFELFPALGRIARYGAANLTGGLPLYVPDAARPFVSAILAIGLCLIAFHARRSRGLLLRAAIATPLGLLALGAVFDNTPIELRYLSFSVPFVALMVAGAVRRRPWALGAVLFVQTLSIAGLIVRPETMQPAKATAAAAVAMGGADLVLLPRGNDGVGTVGAFAREAPPDVKLLVIGPYETPDSIRARTAGFRRIVLATIAADTDSKTAIPAMRAAFAGPDWRPMAFGFNIALYERVVHGD